MPSVECAEEFEMLESIYKEDGLKIETETSKGESTVSMILHPATAGDTESRYVTITVVLCLSEAYPDELPKIEFHNPRGVSEEQLNNLYGQLVKASEELLGSSMLYQLIAMVQDFLTSNNRPSSECPICLTSFSDFDVFYTPTCYHHFHSRCLGIYLQNVVKTYNNENPKTVTPSSEIQKLCPVCRVELDANIDIDKLLSAPPASEDTEEFLPTITLPLVPDEKLQQLFNKQRDQGGIIDLTDGCKRLLVISQPTPQPTPREPIHANPESATTTAPVSVQPRAPVPSSGRQETAKSQNHHHHRHHVQGRSGRSGGSSGHSHYYTQRHHGHAHLRNTANAHTHASAEGGHQSQGQPQGTQHGGSLHREPRGSSRPQSSSEAPIKPSHFKAPSTHQPRPNSTEDRSAVGEGHGRGGHHDHHHPRRRYGK